MCMAGAGMLQGVMSGLSSIVGYDAKVADFNAEEIAWETNYKNAMVSGKDEMNQLTLKAIQNQDATQQKLQEYDYEGAVKAAEAEAAAAQGGVGGNSVDTVINGVLGQAARNRYVTKVNGDMEAQQIAQEQKGVVAEEVNRVNSMPRPQAPNPAEAFLGVAGAALNGLGGQE